MITVYFGRPDSLAPVRRAAQDHAAWLDRPLSGEQRSISPEASVFAGWDPHTADDHYRYLCICQNEAECRFDDRMGRFSSRVLVHLSLAEGRLHAETRLGSAVQLHHARLPHGWLLTDDVRLLRRLARWELDPVGVYGLLKFGAVPAPHTILAGVTRLRPGEALVYDASSDRWSARDPWREEAAALRDKPAAGSLDEARERLIGAVDGALEQLESGSVLLFSGGIDSSLLAVRLAALGRRDIALAHLEFGHLPEATKTARALAVHLRLELSVATYDPASAGQILKLAPREWPYPFVGPSVLPTHAALELGLSRGSNVLVEGTASEVLAAKTLRWRPRQTLRSRLLATAAGAYVGAGMWRVRRLERFEAGLLRARQRGENMPPAIASLVLNTLDGLAYSVPGHVQQKLNRSILSLTEGLPHEPDGIEAMAVTSVGLRRAGRYVAKLMGPLSVRGASCSHPYMSPAMVEAALTSAGPWSSQHKPIFKAELVQQLPPELATRQPSMFTPRPQDVLADATVQQAVREAVGEGQPLASFVRRSVIESLLADVSRSGSSSFQTAGRLLWGLAFGHRWLRGTEFA